MRDRLHLRAELAGGLVAQFRLRLQRAQDDLIEVHVDLHLARGRLEFVGGQFAGEHLVKHDAKAVNVRAVVGGDGAVMLLWRGVVRRANSLGPRLSEVAHLSQHSGISVPRSQVCSHHLRDAKVGDLHCAALIDQQILRLDVAMHDAVIMRALQSLTHRRHDAQRFLWRQLLGLKQLTQVHAIHELHDEEVEAASLPEVMHRDDVRMVQCRERMSFLLKPCRELRIVRAFRCEQLQCDETVQ